MKWYEERQGMLYTRYHGDYLLTIEQYADGLWRWFALDATTQADIGCSEWEHWVARVELLETVE